MKVEFNAFKTEFVENGGFRAFLARMTPIELGKWLSEQALDTDADEAIAVLWSGLPDKTMNDLLIVAETWRSHAPIDPFPAGIVTENFSAALLMGMAMRKEQPPYAFPSAREKPGFFANLWRRLLGR